MMSERAMGRYTDGTSALKPDFGRRRKKDPVIIAFPRQRARGTRAGSARAGESEFQKPSMRQGGMRNRLVAVLEASEMFCSLLFEDYRGCSYGIFTRKGIALASTAAAIIAMTAIFFGY